MGIVQKRKRIRVPSACVHGASKRIRSWRNTQGRSFVAALSRIQSLDLTLDVHASERRLLSGLEKAGSFAGQQPDCVIAFSQKTLATMFANESGAFIIGLKAKLFSDEA